MKANPRHPRAGGNPEESLAPAPLLQTCEDRLRRGGGWELGSVSCRAVFSEETIQVITVTCSKGATPITSSMPEG